MSLLLLGKQLTVYLLPNDKTYALEQKLEFWQAQPATTTLTASQYLDFLNEISGNFNTCDFLILDNEICQHLEDLHHSVNQYSPSDQC